ncbi:MAG: hypothetical protein P4L22_07555 [Candidatus Babeliales bacterium]|nr:hypothetical protein [Candidatus Babeliales bacterium]
MKILTVLSFSLILLNSIFISASENGVIKKGLKVIIKYNYVPPKQFPQFPMNNIGQNSKDFYCDGKGNIIPDFNILCLEPKILNFDPSSNQFFLVNNPYYIKHVLINKYYTNTQGQNVCFDMSIVVRD